MIIDLMMHRFEFMMRFSKGLVLDVGVADCAQWRYPIPRDSITNPPNITDIILLDCDKWENNLGLKFIRAFAEYIPLSDLSVDTVIFGDILEHVNDPNLVLQEAKRLTKDRIIISVPAEFEWESNNPNIKRFETREKHLANGHDLSVMGYDSTVRHPSQACTDALDDTKFEHIHHKRFFTEKTFKELIEKNFEKDIWEWYIFRLKYSYLNFVNFGAVIWRKNNNDKTDYSPMKDRLDIRVS